MELTNLVTLSLDKHGEIEVVDGNQIYKNSVNVNALRVLWEGDYTDGISVVYLKDGNPITNAIPLIYVYNLNPNTVSEIATERSVFQHTIPTAVMALTGEIVLSFRVYNNEGQALTTGEYSLYINNSAINYTGMGAASSAEELQQQVNVLQGTVDGFSGFAEEVRGIAENALDVADEANAKATQAGTTAAQALSVANGIDAKATQALSTAQSASAKADTATATANGFESRVATLETSVANVESDLAQLDETVNNLIEQGGGGGGAGVYVSTFTASNFGAENNGEYTFTISASAHVLGTGVSVVSLQKQTASGYVDVLCNTLIDASGNVSVVATSPFAGKIKLIGG